MSDVAADAIVHLTAIHHDKAVEAVVVKQLRLVVYNVRPAGKIAGVYEGRSYRMSKRCGRKR